MMVAVVILAVGLLGLAGTSGYVVRQVSGGARQSTAAQVIQSRLEWMRSVPCDSIRESTVTSRGVKEHWVPVGGKVNGVQVVVDTVNYTVGGAAKTQVYTITVQCG